ncbi:hypothetical protein [Pseudoalteromonas sp. Angola-4]|uniref:hypothetical protein n=1 Tax=Pseudoalteromonas sp. Angola-4 TaxID=3025335 RepID=UPI0023581FF9|nr:hypothetical protein [Pseudoalteromonas sp. Angola-4]MDC9511491.1 hypothetical protein [Pseudoalteromonas sp. Angola-4]
MILDRYNKTFSLLSLFFLIYFFIIPMLLVYFFGGVYLGESLSIKTSKLYFLIFSLVVFITGFLCVDLFSSVASKLSRPKLVTIEKATALKDVPISGFVYLCIFVYFLYVMYQIFFLNIAVKTYAIRTGEENSDLTSFFILNVFNALKLFILMCLLSGNKVKQSFFVVLFFLLALMLQSSGRLSLLLNLCILLMFLLPLKPQRLALMIIPSVVLLLPLIFSLKEIIYSVSTEYAFDFTILNTLKATKEAFLLNFGHPFVSYLQIDSLIELMGFRYMWDYPQGFLFYLKLIGLDFGDSITYYNTEAILGVRKSIIPPGYFAFGYAQLGMLGVFFAGITYRLIGKLGELFYRIFFKNVNTSAKALYIAEFYIAFICANSFYHGDLRILVMSLFFPMLFSIILKRLYQNESV